MTIRATLINRSRGLAGVLAVLALASGMAHAATPKGCPAAGSCMETRSFLATVTNFRTSTQGPNRVLTATVQFQNRTDKPLTLGYVKDSGVALDDLGNRYVVPGANAVRAMGEIAGTAFDPKFTLEPGESSDARFELSWTPGKEPVGASYELDLAVREITPTTGDQFRLGQEHAVHFAPLKQMSARQAPTAVASATPVARPKDVCGGSPRCFNAGTFVAEVMQVSASAMTGAARNQTVSINIRFRNVSDKPVILAYHSGSSAALDNFGNAYAYGRPNHDASVKGIGMAAGRTVDTQFALTPGQTRNATFSIIRFNAAPPIGEAYNYDVVIDEVEVLPGQVIRTARQNSLSFANLRPGTFSGGSTAVAAADALVGAGTSTEGGAVAGAADATEVANKMLDLFNRAKKKN